MKVMRGFWVLFFILLLAGNSACVAGKPRDAPAAVAGGTAAGILEAVRLPVPQNEVDRSYLGLALGKDFLLPEVKAKVILLEVLSVYCPHCQKAAPLVNEVYRRIDEDKALRGEIKMMGVGAVNSAYELGLYKEKYKVPFPLFADEELIVTRAVHAKVTPTFVVLKREAGGKLVQVKFQQGGFENVDDFVHQVASAGGLD